MTAVTPINHLITATGQSTVVVGLVHQRNGQESAQAGHIKVVHLVHVSDLNGTAVYCWALLWIILEVSYDPIAILVQFGSKLWSPKVIVIDL